uniref:Uncharacterized protein n=1 Tax=Strombidinopsis acuminata TaxID=141414 RepID=A0A7S3TMM2_9SPIT|mmetsp:Transcript_71181/g.98561  ORF Transcript_71181/g.98561 Transcript_71181/m.98561 type:complete len:103 (+) Transcript_71181:394-702(+)
MTMDTVDANSPWTVETEKNYITLDSPNVVFNFHANRPGSVGDWINISWGQPTVKVEGVIDIKTSRNVDEYNFKGEYVEMYIGENATMLAMGAVVAASAVLSF